MSGGIYTDQKCPICSGGMKDNHINSVSCPIHPERDILKKMVEAGRNLAAIKKVLKSRSEDSIRGQARNMGVDITGKPTIDMEEFKRMMKGK